MNKTFKRIAAATLAAATLATTMISASAYDANATKYKYNPYELKTTVYTANGTQAYTAAQRAMYPTFTELGMQNGIYKGMSSGDVNVCCGQRYMGVNEWAKKDGAIAAVFQYCNDQGSPWVGGVDYYYSGGKPMTFGPDKTLWVQNFNITNIGRGRAAILQYVKSAELDQNKTCYAPLVARVTEHDPVISDIDVISTETYRYGRNNTLKIEFDAAFMGMDVEVYVGKNVYYGKLTHVVPADEYKGTLGKAVYTVENVPGNGITIDEICCYTNEAFCVNPMVYLDGNEGIYSSYWQNRYNGGNVNKTDPNFVGGTW